MNLEEFDSVFICARHVTIIEKRVKNVERLSQLSSYTWRWSDRRPRLRFLSECLEIYDCQQVCTTRFKRCDYRRL